MGKYLRWKIYTMSCLYLLKKCTKCIIISNTSSKLLDDRLTVSVFKSSCEYEAQFVLGLYIFRYANENALMIQDTINTASLSSWIWSKISQSTESIERRHFQLTSISELQLLRCVFYVTFNEIVKEQLSSFQIETCCPKPNAMGI